MLGKYLKNYRLDNNLRQCDMARKLKISHSYYCQIENGALKPGIVVLGKLAKLLKVDGAYLRSLL